MAKRRSRSAPPHGEKPAENIVEAGFRRRRTELKIRRRPSDGAWELVHPRAALERTEDLDEVEQMLDAGEVDIAIDELRWLLDGCSDFVAAHRLLGELALEGGDAALARGHFGYAYEIALSALPREGLKGTMPYRIPANQALFQAGKGLALCLRELGKTPEALSVLDTLLKLDPADPLALRALADGWLAGVTTLSPPG